MLAAYDFQNGQEEHRQFGARAERSFHELLPHRDAVAVFQGRKPSAEVRHFLRDRDGMTQIVFQSGIAEDVHRQMPGGKVRASVTRVRGLCHDVWNIARGNIVAHVVEAVQLQNRCLATGAYFRELSIR